MPLHDGDINVDRITSLQVKGPKNSMVRGLQYRFTVRGHGPFYVEVPEEGADAGYIAQLIMRYGAEQCDILDRFSS